MSGTNNHHTTDRLRLGSTTAITNTCALSGVGGYAIWENRRGGRQNKVRKEKHGKRKKAKRMEMKVGTLNVGTTTEKSAPHQMGA